jgi:hypothetical protein
MMRILILISFLISVCTTSVAQMVTVKEKASGYLGKRLVVGIHLKGGPSGSPQTNVVGNSTFININKDLLFSLGYAVKNKNTLGICIGSASTSASLVNDDGYLELGDGSRADVSYTEGRPAISDAYGGVSYKWFATYKGAIAPIGAYIKTGLVIHKYKVDVSKIELFAREDYNDDAVLYKLSETNYTFIAPELQLGLGKSTILFEGLLFDYGLDVGLLVTDVASLISSSSNYNIAYNIRKDIRDRLLRRQAINVHLGLKYAF